MNVMRLCGYIDAYVEARAAQAVLEATAPRDRPRMERAKEATTTARGAMMNAFVAYDTEIQQALFDTYIEHLHQCHKEQLQ